MQQKGLKRVRMSKRLGCLFFLVSTGVQLDQVSTAFIIE